MALYAIGDLHLSLTVNKPMDIFGSGWTDHVRRLEDAFSKLNDDDMIVLCGDISWGIDFEESLEDFRFIDQLPGKKLILKGNHDYWWNTVSKMKKFFAENELNTLDIIHNNSFAYNDYAICGTRGWFYEEDRGEHSAKIFNRELIRMEASLKTAGDREKICFLHYPPVYHGYRCQEIIDLMEKYQVSRCYYGHLHGGSHRFAVCGERNGIEYRLIAADYIGFKPEKILD